jgi:hypothetical protein
VLPADFCLLSKTIVIGHKLIWQECPGNLHLREVAHEFIPTYLAAKNKNEMYQAITDILRTIQEESPVGAFVQEKEG